MAINEIKKELKEKKNIIKKKRIHEYVVNILKNENNKIKIFFNKHTNAYGYSQYIKKTNH